MFHSTSTPESNARASGRETFLWGLFLCALVCIAYWKSLGGAFLWDDDLHIWANPTIVGPLGLREIWTTARANYFPLVLTNFWVQHALWGLDPFGYHIVTVGMHTLAAVLLWRVLLRLGIAPGGAWLGAALWALHPVQVESVAWICELKNTQSAVFFLLSILAYQRWLAGRNGGGTQEGAQSATASHPGSSTTKDKAERTKSAAMANPTAGTSLYWWALAAALAAILSKPSTVMLPVVLALIAWWRSRAVRHGDLLRLAPFFLLSALAAGWTIWEQKFHSGAVGAAWEQSIPEKLAIAGRIVWFYLGKLAWPEPLIFIYPRWAIDATSASSYLGIACAAVGLGWLGWRNLRGDALSRSAPVFFAAAYFAALLFPVLGFFNIYFFRYSYVGDHFQYLASMGPLALAGAVIAWTWNRLARRTASAGAAADAGRKAPRKTAKANTAERAASVSVFSLHRFAGIALAAGLLAALVGLTVRQTRAYADNVSLWTHTLERNPGATMAWVNLADTYKDLGRYEEAIAAYRRAIEQRPQDSDNWNDLGAVLCLAGRPGEALPVLEHARRLVPNDPVVHDTLGNALARLGRHAEAAQCFREAVRLEPKFAKAHLNLGRALLATGRARDAVAPLQIAAGKFPEDFEAQSLYGMALVNSDRLEEAVAPLEKAIKLQPAAAPAHDNLGQVLIALGRYAEGRRHLAEALRLRGK